MHMDIYFKREQKAERADNLILFLQNYITLEFSLVVTEVAIKAGWLSGVLSLMTQTHRNILTIFHRWRSKAYGEVLMFSWVFPVPFFFLLLLRWRSKESGEVVMTSWAFPVPLLFFHRYFTFQMTKQRIRLSGDDFLSFSFFVFLFFHSFYFSDDEAKNNDGEDFPIFSCSFPFLSQLLLSQMTW